MGHRFEGKTALVTGAASGIGLGCAQRLASEGAHVFLSDVQAAQGEAAAAALRADGFKASFIAHDVTDEARWTQVLAAIQQETSRLDIAVLNAGICVRAPVIDMDLTAFRRVFAINVEGTFLGFKHVIPLMRETGGGSIIVMSSVSGIKGIPEMSAYSSSKGATRLMSKAIALEHAKDNIRVNSVHPGMIDTPIMDALVGASGSDRSELVDRWSVDTVPTGRSGSPADVAGTVAWLASDDAAYVNAAEFVVDGGMAAL